MLRGSCLAVILLLACQPGTVQGNIWEAKADIVFVLDASDTVGPDEWTATKSMLLSLVQQLTIGPSNIQIGAVAYGSGPHNEFYLNQAANASQLEDLINAMTFTGGTADAAEAIRFAYTTSFSSAHGMRDGVPHIIVHITDGPSDNPGQLLQEAENAHNQSITIFNIGVGPGVEFSHLAKVASDPSTRYVLQADTFTSLSNMVPLLASRINNEIPVTTQELPKPNSCLTKADLVLLIDSSSSVGQEDFGHLEDFVKDLIVQLPIGPDQVHLGLVQFSSHPSLEFPLNMYSDRMSMLKAVESLQFMGGGTNTGDALQYVTASVYNKDGGARLDVPRVTIVITDGQSIDTVKTRLGAERARQNNIGLVAVGVGSHVNNQELTDIANNPESDYVFSANSYRDLKAFSNDILRATCSLNAMITAQPTVSSGASTTADPCYDKLNNCKDYSERSCTDYETWARENCKKHCGFCQTAEELACEDQVQNCDSYGIDVCSSDKYQQWAHENCKRFCGFCATGSTKLGFYGKCMYKGVAYVQSEKWQDGCDYECVCEDAREGQYRCYNRCPVYHNLPPECTLVGVPNECCLKPVCNFRQQLTISQMAPGPSYNAQKIAVCVYQGKQYFQGQTWDVGCDQKCVCTNATLGAYKCQSYCPEYPVLPKECHLVQEPGQCCRKPVCEFNTQTGSFTGFGTLSGRGVGMAVPHGAECVDVVVDCESYGRATCTEERDWAQVNCAKYCGFCSAVTATAGPNDMCYYNGQNYTQGETWQIGCDTECVCEDAVYGYYRCYNSCPSYLNLPSECTVVQQAGTCCEKMECGSGTFYPSSTNVMSVGNGGGLVVHNANGGLTDLVPTLPSGATLPPGTFGGSTGLANIRLDGCLFNGLMYIQSQQWHDGCKHTCVCQDASTGHFSCRERCPKYNNVPSGCGTQPDPNDPCCTMPDCPASLGYVAIPVYGKGVQGIGAVVTPNLPDLVNGMFTAKFTMVFSGFTVAPPTAPTGSVKPGGLDYCEYHGQRYHQGERWEDGCDYNCVCEDASTGSWRCVDKCEKYVDLPVPYCHLEQDPLHPCCQRPVCNFEVGHGQIKGNATIPTTTTTTMKPTTPGYWEPMCIYKGVQYAVGQSWFDGCSLKCKCDNADQNTVTCVTRCPSYPDEYNGCPQLPDPQDPTCCVVPVCSPTAIPYLTPYPGATQSPYLIPPQIPVIPPGKVTGGNTTGYCEYSGIHYSQDEKWQDGCDYNCVCDDAQTGHYTCTESCVRYGALPSTCRLITDYTNPCCSIPTCSGTDTFITGSGHPPTGSTPTPAEVCVYNNAQYQQGQVWQEGCSKLCRCEDAKNGLYVCTDRCPQYNDYPPECTLVTDPEDACCLKPKCNPSVLSSTTIAPNPHLIPTLAPGKITGTATFPTPTPGPGGNVPSINYCIYDGVPYAQGDTWQDGCNYNCACTNSSVGYYECTERCPRYVTIPKGCVLVRDVNDPCCQRPVCNPGLSTPNPDVTYSPTPGVTGSTLSPNTKSTVSPGPVTTAQPKEVCIYKNEYYTQGQKWYDGCDFTCTCEDAKSGIYRCIERCPRYESLPPQCHLGPDPDDPLCCEVPSCYMTPLPDTTAGYLIPPLKPGVVSGGSVTPKPLPYNTPTPGPDGITLVPPQRTPSPRHVCVYNGQDYNQGQKWADGCDYDCECVDAFSGRYQCTEKCYKWTSIPAQCTMVTDPNNPCCEIPYCNSNISTSEPQSTVSPQPQTTREPFVGPDGSTLSPPTMRTLSPHRNRCLYNGVPYKTGETWEDGCDQKCVCENGESNIYRCDQRCTTYQLPENCVFVTDPDDSCCQVPSCEPVTQSTASPLPGTTLVPPTGPDGSTLAPSQAPHVTPSKPPYLIPTGVTGTIIGSNNNPNKSESLGCVYDGVTHQQGEKWDDGCKQKCVCLNGTAGVYECTERCTRLLNVPPNCQLVIDPADPCCKTALCKPVSTAIPSATPTLGPQATPVSGQTTSSSKTGAPTPTVSVTQVPKKMCVYKGQYYVEGQQWYDGCDKVCVCEEEQTTRCSDRCKTFPEVPSSCQMVASPEDPTCCMVPQCLPTPGPTGYPTPGPNATPTQGIYTNPTGVITGIAPTPTPRPGYPTPGFRNACVYNGQEYKEGQQWQDGCDYNCVCLNETTGYFKCVQRCPDYAVVPSQCSLIPDPLDFCCKQVKCDFNQTTPNPFSPTPKPTRIPNPNLHTTTYPTPGQQTTVSSTPGVGLPTPTNEPPTLAPQFTFCVYNGVVYRQGENWKIGCDQVCTCEDSTRNYYICADRCPSYPQLPSNCNMRVDPDDACCLVPECYVSPTLSPDATPAQVPGQTTAVPPLIPTGVPGVITKKPNTNTPTGQSGCEQNGVIYQPGATWREGCQYVCECLDTSGLTKCTERCTPYPNIPDYCTMMPDPSDSCCMIPSCLNPLTPSPTPGTTVSPGASIATPSSVVTGSPQPTTPVYSLPKHVCVYKGASYTEGQRWYDGCDSVCICEDSQTGFYRCSDRCPTYTNVGDNCKFVPDVRDPTCCVIPDCTTPGLVNVTGNVGVITGNGRTPVPTPPQQTLSPRPGSTLEPPTSVPVVLTPQPKTDVCVYNGRVYSQGQRWQDGCTYNCECINATVGQYRCTDRCLRYPQNIISFCTMKPDPKDPCCMIPDCDNTPTPMPGSTDSPPLTNVTTVAPPLASTPFPTLHPTLAPGVEFCVYKGVPYSHGQTWNDGCDKTCRCEDVVTGQVNCDDRCPSYTEISADCQLVTDPQDSCCRVPDCHPQTNNNTVIITGPVGVITGNSLPPNHRGPLTRNNVCIYHGRTYKEGEVWDDGCSYTCECVDANLGKYICREKCERIVELPSTCMMIKDEADPCCLKPYCQPWPPKVPTPEPGATPSLISTVSPTGTTPSVKACIYKGAAYRQDQLWYDDCNAVCKCEDAAVGFYRCQERCTRYTPNAGCTMVPDPQDPTCCEIPKCPLLTPTPRPGVSPTPGIVNVVTKVPGQIEGIGKVPTLPPTLAPTATPTPVTGPDGSTITPKPRPTTGCYYKGVAYQETEKWEDGCEFVCECIDGSTGRYRCSEKCPILPDLPDECVLVQNPKEPCCMVPYCDFVNPTPFPDGTPTPYPTLVPSQIPGTGPTSVPSITPTPYPTGVPNGFCVYNGAYYRAGEKWTDGCDLECVCDDATTGLYTCTDRCKTYGELPPGCVLRVSPDDSCCLVPDCPQTPVEVTPSLPGTVTGAQTPNPSYILVGVKPGSFTGTGGIGRPVGNYGTHTGFSNGCVYKNSLHQQNDVWEDSCDYMCVCVDALRGKYQCTDRCVSYFFLPQTCRMEPDPADKCCQRARCYPQGFTTLPPPTTTPTTTPTPTPVIITGETGTGPSGTGPTVSGHTGTGPSGSGSTVTVKGTATSHTGTGPVITGQPGTGPSGSGSTVTVKGTATSHTGTGPVITGQPGTGPSGSGSTVTVKGTATSHTGTGPVITGQPGTGPSGSGSTVTVKGTATSHTGTGPVITGQPGTGPSSSGSTVTVKGTATSHTGTGPVITGQPGTGPSGSGSTVTVKGTATSHTGTGPVITGQPGTGPSGSGSTVTVKGTATSHTGTGPVITGQPGTGPSGSGSTVTVKGTATSHMGTGPVITGQPGTGPSGAASTVTPLTTGTGTAIVITPNIPGNVSGSGPTISIGSTVPGFTGAEKVCIYKGTIYHAGESWDDGCDLRCTCENSTQGFYTCTYRCPAYSGLPQYCHLQPDPNDICCKKPSCTVPGTQLVPEIGGTPTRSPTLAPSVTNVIPLGTHTIISGSSRPPGQGVQTIYGGRSSCIYKGVEYIPGESWDDGCKFTCTCIGDNTGLYRCVSKCPSYPALPSYCTLSPIPGKCCPSLSCDVPNIGIYTPIPQLEPNAKPTAGPNGIYPTPQPTVDPQLILGIGVGMIGGTGLPGGGAKVPSGYLNNLGGIRDKCIYNLKMYNQAERWDVGCNYTCMCLDSLTGFYKCNERCLSYDSITLPPACKLVEDPRDSCCRTPSCPDPTNTGHQITNITQIQQLYPIVGSYVGGTSGFRPGYVPTGNFVTHGGTRSGCVYKGKLYREGARWDDGCDFSCRCMNGTTGLYQCTAKCVTYSLLPPACRLVDVAGQCCPKILCDPITTTSPCRDKIDNCAQYRQEACTGAYAAWAHEHCPLFCGFCHPDYTTTPPPCEDKLPNCKNFDSGGLCTSVAYQDWVQTNCRKYCDVCRTTTVSTTVWTTPASGCFDAISYCDEFGPSTCSNPDYKAWALKNCRKYCGLCHDVSPGTTTEAPCVDLKGTETCRLYGKSSCGGQFLGWALHNCRKYCDLCGEVTIPTHPSVSTTPRPRCQDVMPNCNAYDRQYCNGPYLAWAADNCAAYCNLCNYELTTISKVEEKGWLVLLKGVAGIPGDLWQLWSTNAVANPNVPQAQYLTNQYPGHYKPAIANQWDVCHFERVKVAILSGGIEKANIIFNVGNQGKNDWFKPENVISSTFNDLPTTSGSFAMAKDPNSGNEFSIGSFNDCQGTGWIFVSTNENCPYQQTGTAPQFYYSLTNTVSQLVPGYLGEGDVFAILAQGGNCMSGLLTTQSAFTNMLDGCFYKGQVYKQGENWLDGCDLNCTCEDSSTGQYYCIDQCPTYTNLPAECTLQKIEGKCCPELKCPFPTGDGCFYKNKVYPQGATWQDGCDYDCTCNDGETGQYNCIGICQDWSNLPEECHMEDPDPGMCCPRPVCPSPIVVDFTPR